jgi:hypothetical protein
MRVPGRKVYLVAAMAALGAGLAACGSASPAGAGATGSASGSQQVAAVSRDVSFTVDDTVTYGTLDIPAHPVLAPSAVAALQAWARPYALSS